MTLRALRPTIARAAAIRAGDAERIDVDGETFGVHEWRGSGPPHLHVHHEDDEAWHVLEGTLKFRFADGAIDAGPGDTVFVPAGVAHTYEAAQPARYLVVLTPRLRALIQELQNAPDRSGDADIYHRHRSEIVPTP
ncbi:MAG TPA: cupin domain-containing protein [Candidatus Dormibacteraeota bacterium]|nr:cupin domain-containing protein [Candidatus Dormibacteraeota bacterium]